MKLDNRLLELRAIKTITNTNKQKQAAKLFSNLDIDAFYWEESREAYTRIRTLLRKTGKMPSWSSLITDPKISEETRDNLRRYKKPVSKDIEGTVTRLNEYKKLRKIFELCKGGLESLRGDKVDVEELVQQIREQATALDSSKNRKDWFVNIGGDDDTALKMAAKAINPEAQMYVPTGFQGFDRVNGGIPFGSLMLIAGETGGGKSIVAGQIARNAALAGYRTAVVPLEMTNVEMMQRELARGSDTDMTNIMNAKRMSSKKREAILKDFEENLHKKIKAKKSLLSYFNPEEDLTIEEVLYGLEPYDYDVIIIDYVGLLAGVNGDDQWNALRKVTRFCKIYAKNNNKIIILAAQLNAEGKLRYAQGMKEDSNLMWTWQMTPEVKETGIIKIKQEKARNQSDHSFMLKFHWATMRVEDVELDDMESDQKKMGHNSKNRKSTDRDDYNDAAKRKKKKAPSNYLDDNNDVF